MERKSFTFEVKAIDEAEGVFEGYASTFRKFPDSYGEIVDRGAFKKTIQENKGRIKILWNHNADEPIGIPLELREDDVGLYVKGKLSLGVQRAREVLDLMKDGVINVMSIGYRTITESMVEGTLHLKELKLFDTSPVTFAADDAAAITSVKSATPFGNLPLGDRAKEWDATAADKRVREWAGGEDIDWTKYRKAFLWYDNEADDEYGSYKLQIADVIDGTLIAMPRGVFAAAGVVEGARGGVDIPSEDEAGVKRHIERYYAKMRTEFDDETIIAPWKKSDMDTEEIESTIEYLQALLDRTHGKQEPDSTPEDDGAALDEVLDIINAEMSGFDTAEAERLLDTAIARAGG